MLTRKALLCQALEVETLEEWRADPMQALSYLEAELDVDAIQLRQVLREMLRNGVQLTATHFNAALAHPGGSDPDDMKKIFELMTKGKVRPDGSSYAIAIGACAEKNLGSLQ